MNEWVIIITIVVVLCLLERHYSQKDDTPPPVAAGDDAEADRVADPGLNVQVEQLGDYTPLTHMDATQRGEQLLKSRRYDEALEAFQQGVEDGDSWAEMFIGRLFDNGLGVEHSRSKAAVWYRRASISGNKVAQNRLGELFAEGKGVTRNEQTAFMLWEKAARQGYPPAQRHLARCYDEGIGTAKDYLQAKFWRDCAADSTPSQYEW